MNKDELLKIYSAYLPYGLKVQLSEKDSYPNKVTELSGIMHFGYLFLGSGGRFGFTERSIEDVKPILYDLSYLSKEIEHNCLIIKPIEYISTSIADRNKILKMVEGKESLDILLQWKFEKLLKFHFNVFQLPEDQFINKANLTNK